MRRHRRERVVVWVLRRLLTPLVKKIGVDKTAGEKRYPRLRNSQNRNFALKRFRRLPTISLFPSPTLFLVDVTENYDRSERVLVRTYCCRASRPRGGFVPQFVLLIWSGKSRPSCLRFLTSKRKSISRRRQPAVGDQ